MAESEQGSRIDSYLVARLRRPNHHVPKHPTLQPLNLHAGIDSQLLTVSSGRSTSTPSGFFTLCLSHILSFSLFASPSLSVAGRFANSGIDRVCANDLHVGEFGATTQVALVGTRGIQGYVSLT